MLNEKVLIVTIAITAVTVVVLPSLRKPGLPIIYDGHVEAGFEGVFETFKEHYTNGVEPSDGGSAFVAYHKERKVVDIWGGYADKQALRPWKQDTLANIYSCGKGVAAICIGMLVDRGLLRYEDKVVKYWPEFGKHGKENVTVEMLVSHQAAVPFPNEPLSWDVFRDDDRLANVLADSIPQWKIGTGHGYHCYTMASFCSVLLQKIDSKHSTLGQFVHEELEIPFNIDIFFGVPKELFHRVVRSEPPAYTLSQNIARLRSPLTQLLLFEPIFGDNHIWNKLVKNIRKLSNPYILNDPDNRVIEMPSAMGVATADGLARLFGIVANGGQLNVKKIMSSETIGRLNTGVTKGLDKVIMEEVEWGPGVTISRVQIGKAFGHTGAFGQEALANPQLRLGYAFLTNTPTLNDLETGNRYLLLRDSLYKCVQNIEK